MGLPSGVVTFVFSDIEGSTLLWESDPDGMRRSLERHDELARSAVDEGGGHLFKHTGDGFGAVFASAAAALASAARFAAHLDAESWQGPALRCRIGVHTGEAEPNGDDYFGPTVTRATRVMDSGNGGQVVASDAVFRLVDGRAPDRWTFVDEGEHRLRDLGEPIGLHRLVGPGGDVSRRLRTLDAAPHNLPVQLTTFVGREADIKELSDLVRRSRLVTLTGIGGVGKTRLSLQVAAEVLPEFSGGAWFVELAPLTDTGLIAETAAAAVGVPQDATIPALDRLLAHLSNRRALLVIDNCEHLIDEVAGFVDKVLRACPEVVALATSREGLAVTGEALWRVPSLRVDDDAAAVELFAERARLVRPDFSLTDDNRGVVADLCTRLDGIPLAIELATARLKMMSVDQVAERLADRFRLLTGGSRTAVERQRTLRAMMDWSFDLLDDSEKTLLRRLSVFIDGFEYAAAEEVCSGDGLDRYEILDLLGRLVEASLVAFDEEHGLPRYRLLETVRQYALDELVEAGGADDARRRHARWVHSLATSYDERFRADKDEAIRRTDPELGNIRAALTWALEADEGPLAVEIAAGLRQHFWTHVAYAEAFRWLDAALSITDDDASPAVPRATANALTDAFNIGAHDAVRRLEVRAERLLAIADPAGSGDLHSSLASTQLSTDPLAADRLMRLACEEMRSAGNPRWTGPLQNRMLAALTMHDPSTSSEIERLVGEAIDSGLGEAIHATGIFAALALVSEDFDRVLEITAEEPSDDYEQFWLLTMRGTALRLLDRLDDADETLARAATTAGNVGKAFISRQRAMVRVQRGDIEGARRIFNTMHDPSSDRNLTARAEVTGFASLVAADAGRFPEASVLLGHSQMLAEKTHMNLPSKDRLLMEEVRDRCRTALGDAFESERRRGAELPWESLPLSEFL